MEFMMLDVYHKTLNVGQVRYPKLVIYKIMLPLVTFFNRPGVAGALLQTPSSLID